MQNTLCPFKFDALETKSTLEIAACQGADCEWFNVDYGKCSIYLLALAPGEKVKLEHSNERRK